MAKQKENNVDTSEQKVETPETNVETPEQKVENQDTKVDTPEQKVDDFYPDSKMPTEEGWNFLATMGFSRDVFEQMLEKNKVSSEEVVPERTPEEHQAIVKAKAQARIDAIDAQQKEQLENQKKAEQERKAAEKKIKA